LSEIRTIKKALPAPDKAKLRKKAEIFSFSHLAGITVPRLKIAFDAV
jgi:hypothetical protein